MVFSASKSVAQLLRKLLIVAVATLVCGCATLREAGEACESEASERLATVFRSYEEYRDAGLTHGLIANSRLALEQARANLFAEGALVGEVTSCPKVQRRKPSWRDLNGDFDAAQILVRELEMLRGVRFVEMRGDRAIWVNQTTGEELDEQTAASI